MNIIIKKRKMIFKKNYKVLREFAQNTIFQRHACLFYTCIKYECKLITFKFYKTEKNNKFTRIKLYNKFSKIFFIKNNISRLHVIGVLMDIS